MGTPSENLAEMEERRRKLIEKLNEDVSVEEAAQIKEEIEFLNGSIERMRAAIFRDRTRDYPII